MTTEKDGIIKKMFDAALKEKINQLARKYDYALILELWTGLAKTGCVKSYFCKWRWNQHMTIMEAINCLDDYFNGLEALLEKRQGAGHRRKKNRETGNIIGKSRKT